MEKKLIDKLVDKFLGWPLPESVCSDQCASIPGYPHRCGTNLMTADEAKQMFAHVLGGAVDDELVTATAEEGEAYMRGWFDRENQVPNA